MCCCKEQGIGTGESLEADLKSYSENVPSGAYGLNLLGKICRKTNRSEQAVLYLSQSLQLNPYLWSSFSLFHKHKRFCVIWDTLRLPRFISTRIEERQWRPLCSRFEQRKR